MTNNPNLDTDQVQASPEEIEMLLRQAKAEKELLESKHAISMYNADKQITALQVASRRVV